MGIVIDKYRTDQIYDRQPSAADNYATDASGRLIPLQGEQFEIMPMGSLGVIAYVNIGNSYRQNPYTTPTMRWEVGFSKSRVSFFSPDTDLVLGGVAERPGIATMGFYHYSDLRSLSLGSAREQGGPYVSMVFIIQATPSSQMPVGVRVHGMPQNLHAFATMLTARFIENYAQLGEEFSLSTGELGRFFSEVNEFNYEIGMQTDYFISAIGNTLHITRDVPMN